MKILELEDLTKKIKNIVNNDLSLCFVKNEGSESDQNFQDLKEFLEDNKNEKDLIINNIDDILLFIENGFDLHHLDDENFVKIYNQLKEIELNIICLKLKMEYKDFIESQSIEKNNICKIKTGNVLSIGDEIYLVKRELKKTSKGYEILVELLLSGTFSYVNSIYVDIKNEGFFVLGNIN